MAAHVPVISTNAGGLPEVNIDGETGYTAPIGDVETMAAKAISILGNDDTLNRFKQQAYDHAATFDISTIVPQYEKLYESVLLGEVVEQ